MFRCIELLTVFQLPLLFITLEIKQDQRSIEPHEKHKAFLTFPQGFNTVQSVC